MVTIELNTLNRKIRSKRKTL